MTNWYKKTDTFLEKLISVKLIKFQNCSKPNKKQTDNFFKNRYKLITYFFLFLEEVKIVSLRGRALGLTLQVSTLSPTGSCYDD